MRKSLLIFILLQVCVPLSSYTKKLSFDKPFPMTWYEKGLNAAMGTWHAMNSFFDTALCDVAEESFDVMLGRCVFACFCLEKMRQNKQSILDEDITYFCSLICHLEEELHLISLDKEHEDQIMCLEHMIGVMKNCLKSPGCINTK